MKEMLQQNVALKRILITLKCKISGEALLLYGKEFLSFPLYFYRSYCILFVDALKSQRCYYCNFKYLPQHRLNSSPGSKNE